MDTWDAFMKSKSAKLCINLGSSGISEFDHTPYTCLEQGSQCFLLKERS